MSQSLEQITLSPVSREAGEVFVLTLAPDIIYCAETIANIRDMWQKAWSGNPPGLMLLDGGCKLKAVSKECQPEDQESR